MSLVRSSQSKVLYYKSLECSILVIVQSGGTPWVNSLWNLSNKSIYLK